jgi:aminopeptidase N
MTLLAARGLVAAALFATAVSALAEAPYAFTTTPGKLPKDVVPVQYAAHLIPDVTANTFLGSETIEIDVLKTTSLIMLNAAGLQIDGATLSGKGIGQSRLAPLLDQEQQTLSFKLAQPLAPGRYQLALKFHGTVNRESRGLFHVEYQVGKADKSMLATNMEPTDARRLLPSWDEPSFRANFKLTVDLPATYKAYSNMPVESLERIDGGLLRHTFRMTPKMPSYLLALVAGELERSSVKQDGVELGVVTTAGKQPSAAYGLAVTKDLMKYYNSYFGQPYPLPKLDQIAIPGGFNGAMENWGAVIYDDASLLYDPKSSPDSVMQNSFNTNAHEVAHQWFGNLVTMAWWDNLWLNEGFASWMATKASEQFHPEWRAQLGLLAEREAVMNLDARATTHPIQTPVESDEQAADAFDAITYTKGEAFLRMLEAYLGEEPFRKGIRAYVAKHQYANTTSADLWAALEKASGKPVQKLASDWTTQPGFPLVTVAQSCDNGKRRITLTQEQYRIDAPATDKRLWNVPLQLATVGGKTWTTLLGSASTTFTQPGCDGALVVDPAGVGYFRVQYDKAGFEALAAQVGKLPDATRFKLLADTWSMAQSGKVPLDGYLKLLARYGDEPRVAIWTNILSSLETLDAMAEGEPERPLIRRHIIKLAAPAFARLGWQEKSGEPAEHRLLRPLLARAMARAGDPAAVAQGRALFAAYLVDPAKVSPSLLDFATGVAAREAGQPMYDVLAARAAGAASAEERERFSYALAIVADPARVESTLQMALSSTLPAQLISHLVPAVAQAGHLKQAWAFAVANKDALMKDQEAVSRNSWFPSLVSSSSDAADADMMERYVASNFGPDAQAEAQRVGNAIRTRATQKQRLLPQVRTALK